MSRILKCDREGYEKVRAYLPDEWLGKHAILRDQAIAAANETEYKDNPLFINVSVVLALIEKIEGVKGLEGDPGDWDLSLVPLAILDWLEAVVLQDFLAVFESKNPSLPLYMQQLQDLVQGKAFPGFKTKKN